MVLLALCLVLGFSQAILNNKVTRTLHLYGPNTKSHTSIDILNDAKEGGKDIETYTIALNATLYKDLIEVEVTQNEEFLRTERVEAEDRPDKGVIAVRVYLDEPIYPGEKSKIEVEETYGHRKLAFPKTMKMKDIPKVRVFDNAYYLSFYHSKSTKTTFEFEAGTYILSHTKMDKADEKSHSVRFGAYKEVSPLTIKPVYVHANYDDSLPVFKNVTRTVTISHWHKI